MSAPSSSGRVSTGVAKVLSTPSRMPRPEASFAQAAMSVIDISGLPGVSIQSSLVCGVIAASTASRSLRIDERHLQSGAVDDLVQQPIGAAVDVAAGHDMIAGFSSIVTQCVAAMPEENAKPPMPPSRSASVVSNALRVGLPLRE